MNSLTKKLIGFGLSEKEAKVYLAALELEISSVNEIAKQSGINRSSTYVVLEALKKRGLVGISDDKNVRKYIAASPDTLLHSAQVAAKKQEDVKSEIESILPELKALHKDTKPKPIVKIFEGHEGLTNTFNDTLDMREKIIRVYSSHQKLFKNMPNKFIKILDEYIKIRTKKGIKMRSIHPDNAETRKIVKTILPKSDEWVLIPERKFEFLADLAIYDNKIGYISHKSGGLGIIIESKEIADVMKSIFDLAWSEGKNLEKKELP